MSLTNPKIDIKKIGQAANEAAEKAYLNEVKDYFTGYNSPYKEMIREELKKQEFKFCLELPDVLSKINTALSDEVSRIANNAIANSYIPMVSDALTGMKKEMKISEVLKEILSTLDADWDDIDEFSFEYQKDDRWDWLNCILTTPEGNYEFTLHTADKDKYQLLGFPYNKHSSKTLKIFKDDVTIEMPFTPNILEDKVLRLFFKMMLSNTHLEMDVDGFYEEMFPERDCHC